MTDIRLPTILIVITCCVSCVADDDPGGDRESLGTPADDGDSEGGGDGSSDAEASDEGGSDGATGAPDAQSLTGEEIYAVACAACHGAEAEGTDLAYEIRHPDRELARWVVRNGRPGLEFPGPMAAFSEAVVTDAQLDEVLEWLDAFPQPEAGDALYLDYCGNCHGEDASGGVVGVDIRDKGYHDALEKIRDGEDESGVEHRGEFMPPFADERLSDDEVARITEWLATL